MSNPIPTIAQNHPWLYSAALVVLMLLIEWASRYIGSRGEAAES